VTSVIFDDELSPAQGRNLEKLTSRRGLDRTQWILDIFVQHARSQEGRQRQHGIPDAKKICHTLEKKA